MRKMLCSLLLLLLLFPLNAVAEETQAIVINEIMASNGMYENEESYDWIELYNRSKKTVDLSGWKVSDGKKNLEKFVFPEGTKLKAGDYLTIWCTGTGRSLTTDAACAIIQSKSPRGSCGRFCG